MKFTPIYSEIEFVRIFNTQKWSPLCCSGASETGAFTLCHDQGQEVPVGTFCEVLPRPSVCSTCVWRDHLLVYNTFNEACVLCDNLQLCVFRFPHTDSSVFLIKSTLLGAKRLLGCQSNPSLPLTPSDIIKMREFLDLSSLNLGYGVLQMCILRVRHLIKSPHVLHDIV